MKTTLKQYLAVFSLVIVNIASAGTQTGIDLSGVWQVALDMIHL